MSRQYERLQKCYEYYRSVTDFIPRVGLILGSGLGGYAGNMRVLQEIPYGDIPGFPVSTVQGHDGRFLLGYIGDVPAVVMKGRVHYYEGYSMEEVVLPVRLMKKMGIEILFLTNASGGINREFHVGDFMIITDQISSFAPSPLIGENVDELGERLRGIQSYSLRIEELEASIGALEKELDGLAVRIHEARVASEERLCDEMRRLLVGLGIKHASFSVSVVPLQDYTPSGKDEVKFLFAANKNQEPGELVKVASGGEISRLMLSLKYILSRTKVLPVIIFDEIDTGVSGDIAHRMAVMMREMSSRMQVISISHLPQIAAAGDTHFKVYKEDEASGTISRIRRLADEERVREIAAMMSGSEVTAAALENARLLLRQR